MFFLVFIVLGNDIGSGAERNYIEEIESKKSDPNSFMEYVKGLKVEDIQRKTISIALENIKGQCKD